MTLKIRDYFLYRSNPASCGNDTIGTMIAATGKDQLWSSRSGDNVDVVVIHYTSAVKRYPADPFRFELVLPLFVEYGVSSHYLITRRGTIYRLVPEQFKAWHCGGSIMPQPDGRRNVNEFSIGIELLATEISGFTDSQYRAISLLCRLVEQTNGREMTYIGHDQIAGTCAVELGLRSDCKVDPGPYFDWQRFFRNLRTLRCR